MLKFGRLTGKYDIIHTNINGPKLVQATQNFFSCTGSPQFHQNENIAKSFFFGGGGLPFDSHCIVAHSDILFFRHRGQYLFTYLLTQLILAINFRFTQLASCLIYAKPLRQSFC